MSSTLYFGNTLIKSRETLILNCLAGWDTQKKGLLLFSIYSKKKIQRE